MFFDIIIKNGHERCLSVFRLEAPKTVKIEDLCFCGEMAWNRRVSRFTVGRLKNGVFEETAFFVLFCGFS